MKRIVSALIALVLVMSLFCGIAEENATQTMYVTRCGALKVYAEPAYQGSLIGKVYSNMPVNVIEIIEDGWYKFAHITFTQLDTEYEGYVNAAYLTKGKPMSKDAAGYILSKPGLWLRTEPNLKADKIVLMPWHTEITVNFYCSAWANVTVTVKGKTYTGYCYHEFVNTCFTEGYPEDDAPAEPPIEAPQL